MYPLKNTRLCVFAILFTKVLRIRKTRIHNHLPNSMFSDPLRFSRRFVRKGTDQKTLTWEDDSQFKSKKRSVVEIIINKIL